MNIFTDISWNYNVLTRLAFALGSGILVGMEREYHGRPAGIRTHILVAMGSALVSLISLELSQMSGSFTSETVFRIDPGRIAAGIVTGIGFLGAGVIVKSGISARGLTTAASLWCMAGVGMGFGFGLYGLSIMGTLFMMFTLFIVGRLEIGIQRNWYKYIIVHLAGGNEHVNELKDKFTSRGWKVLDIKLSKDKSEDVTKVEYELRLNAKGEISKLVILLEKTDYIKTYRIN